MCNQKNSNRIRKLRKEKNISIDDLAKIINVSRATINNYERGAHEPKLKTWEKLADFFGVSVGYIQGVSDNKGLSIRQIKDILKNFDERTASDAEIKQVKNINNDLKNMASTLKQLNLKQYDFVKETVDRGPDKLPSNLIPTLFSAIQLALNKKMNDDYSSSIIAILQSLNRTLGDNYSAEEIETNIKEATEMISAIYRQEKLPNHPTNDSDK
jgi:transcriptional regulator with XRE-family HTH domain